METTGKSATSPRREDSLKMNGEACKKHYSSRIEGRDRRNSFDSSCTLFLLIMYTSWKVTLKYESERLQVMSWIWISICDRIVLLGSIGQKLQFSIEEWRPMSLVGWPESLMRHWS